jgi:excisionase family DNA binding protein
MKNAMLTPAEVAGELRVDIRTIYGLIREGTLPHINLGWRTKRIRRSVLDAYIKEREENTN